MATKIADEIRQFGLERHVLDLEVDGLTVVPPDVHGVGEAQVDEMVDLLLARSEQMIGCGFDLDRGPAEALDFAPDADGLAAIRKEGRRPGQFLIQQLARHHRAFRDLAVNPVAVALIRHMIGAEVTRFSSHNSFVKWQDDFGYGPTLGLHADQTAMPLPWGRAALTANTNWCLTDYSKEGGSFAYVPGSHKRGRRPDQPRAATEAVPVECPKGSVIVFHGATWHGAFPRRIAGMRLSVANYYRHMMVTSQEDIQGSFPRELADDCDDPESFRKLAGFGDRFPYRRQSQSVPTVARESAASAGHR